MPNSPLLEKPSLQLPAAEKPGVPSGLPLFRPLAVSAFAANVPLLSWLLLAGRLANGLSLLAGFFI